MKKRILFVDDEAKVLDGLRRMLRPLRNEWDTVFAVGGREALSALGREGFDVVVTDMRMPGMDGGALLAEVKRRYPRMVRIVLSGHSQQESILRSIGPAHQYLAKPCEPDQLKEVVARACALRDLISDEGLRELASQMSTIPSLPKTYLEIVEELQSPDASIRKVGEIVSKDVGMTAKVLQLVNSAFFGLQRHVSDPSQAAGLLGVDTLKALVLSVHIFSQFDCTAIEGFHLSALWSHSAAVGALAKRVATAENAEKEVRDHALMAGLLHDAGKLVIAANLPERYGRVLSLAHAGELALWEAEQQVLRSTHAEVGAYLLGLWGLPDPIVEAVAFHHCPKKCPGRDFTPLTAIHVANALEHEQDATAGKADAEPPDADYLTQLGLEEHLPEWRRLQATALQPGAGS